MGGLEASSINFSIIKDNDNDFDIGIVYRNGSKPPNTCQDTG
jgi:hypothetical protein